ncbi:Dynamin- GTPase protein [Naganishia albida]|nr:Dynamin- GTPase protein [Naganishia albida]
MAMNGDLIALVNKLQDTFNTIGGDAVDLPQIVVVGSQSSGKSSVLETIVGRDFLPRGSGIVTRRPLILQLIHTPAKGEGQGLGMTGGYQVQDLPTPSPPYTEYAEFLHLNRRFTDFDEIRREIEAETFRVAGQNKGVSKLPINLKIYGPGVLNLTLVDLPGLTKVPVGDQPTDIERQIKNLILDYISKPNAVILAVSPANQDIANSDSLKLARSVDPRGLRTIGVLTKLDLMDAGTNALDILTGRTYPLKLGFIGVVNRSQQDINAGLPMEDALRKEEEFFRNHPAYRNLAHRCGTKYLAKSLNHVLMNHIRDKLPDMKARLNTLMGQTQQELNSFGDATFLGEQHRGSLVLKLMTEFARDFVASIDGTSMELSTKELCGGARIYYIFHDVFGMALESVDPTHNLTTQDIRTAIRNSTGPRPSLFVPEIAFDLLIKPQIKLLESPSLRCVELVYEELMKICHNCTSAELQRFPRLHAQIVEVVSELLRERLGPTSDYASSLISIQAAYINTNHPEFVAGSAAIARGELPAGTKPIPSINAAGADADADDDDVSDSEGSEQGGNVNGTIHAAATNNKSRSVSHSQPGDRRQPVPVAPTPRHLGDAKTDKYRAGSLSGVASAPPPSGLMNMSNVSTSPHSTRETFLNYFFGGAGGPGGPPGAAGASASSLQQRNDGRTARDLLPDLGTRKATGAGLHVGRGYGLEPPPAYDMKSLGKHLEATNPGHGLHLTPREEMETTLIRSLIASYFNIVRQTIQDLVPKAIMHLLVNFSKDSVQQRLVTSLYKPDLFPDLLHEDEALVSERTRVKALLDAYKEAFKVLSEVSLKSS